MLYQLEPVLANKTAMKLHVNAPRPRAQGPTSKLTHIHNRHLVLWPTCLPHVPGTSWARATTAEQRAVAAVPSLPLTRKPQPWNRNSWTSADGRSTQSAPSQPNVVLATNASALAAGTSSSQCEVYALAAKREPRHESFGSREAKHRPRNESPHHRGQISSSALVTRTSSSRPNFWSSPPYVI